MHPNEVCVARRGIDLRKIAQRLPQPAAECEGEQRTMVTHVLQAAPQRAGPIEPNLPAFSGKSSAFGIGNRQVVPLRAQTP
jgi:hypothetical protein